MTSRLNGSREQIIWGDVNENRVDNVDEPIEINDDSSEIQEIPPPPSYRRHSYTARVIAGAKRAFLSQSRQFSSPPNHFVTPRRRPHGPDAGKSIHKAAEASQVSPLSEASQSTSHRRSLGPTKRMVAALPPGDPSDDVIGSSLHKSSSTVARKMARTIGSPSHKRKVTPPSGDGIPNARAFGFTTSPARNQGQIPRSGVDANRALDSESQQDFEPAGSPSQSNLKDSGRTSRQVGRKTVSRKPRRMLATKAARKSTVGFREIEQESSSDDSSDHGSSRSQSTSTSSYTPHEDDRAGKKTKDGKHTPPHPNPTLDFFSDLSGGQISDGGSANVEMSIPSYSSCTRSRSFDSIIPDILASLPPPNHNSPLRSRAYSVDADEKATPPPPLLAAFESLSAYTLHLQRTNNLPFLLRNVRKSFRAWCRELHIPFDTDLPISSQVHRQIPLTYEYTSPSGELYTYGTTAGERECPVCSILGVFPSWETLRKHVLWDHGEVEFETNMDETLEGRVKSITIRMKHGLRSLVSPREMPVQHAYPMDPWEPFSADHSPPPPPPTSSPPSKERLEKNKDGSSDFQIPNSPLMLSDEQVDDLKESSSDAASPHIFFRRPDGLPEIVKESSFQAAALASVKNEPEINDLRPITPNEHFDSHQRTISQLEAGSPKPGDSPVVQPMSAAVHSIIPFSTLSRAPTPPPLFDLHGPSHPIGIGADQSLRPATYRPTGPHLYDHLSSLPLDAFGNRVWFVLDKEEEIFELTDVLDEDKIMCALWGRWILLNRSIFIRNYLAGVEAFVDEYWHMVHRAAGWGALRAWLMMLVSRRFLKNIEMVHVLKRYNSLVGKNGREKDAVYPQN